jgi:hypothetical protein
MLQEVPIAVALEQKVGRDGLEIIDEGEGVETSVEESTEVIDEAPFAGVVTIVGVSWVVIDDVAFDGIEVVASSRRRGIIPRV